MLLYTIHFVKIGLISLNLVVLQTNQFSMKSIQKRILFKQFFSLWKLCSSLVNLNWNFFMNPPNYDTFYRPVALAPEKFGVAGEPDRLLQFFLDFSVHMQLHFSPLYSALYKKSKVLCSKIRLVSKFKWSNVTQWENFL